VAHARSCLGPVSLSPWLGLGWGLGIEAVLGIQGLASSSASPQMIPRLVIMES
jgi:hypothetical protein